MPPKRNLAGAGAGEDDEGADVGLTYDQRMALLQAKADVELRIRQAEAENLRLQLDLADRQAQAAAGHGPQAGQQQRFDIFKASGILPVYEEREVELYLANFEKLAEASGWPRDKWSLVLQPKLSGKALKAISRLTVNDVSDYNVVKKAILDELELVSEVYRLRFRGCSKRPTESYADFVHFMSMQFDRWVKSEKVTDFESLKQLILKEQFNDKVPQDIKERLLDREFKTVMALARAADEYAAVHKSGTRQVHSKLGAGNKVNQTTVYDLKSNANNKVMSSDSSGMFNVNDDWRAALAQQQSQHAGFFSKPSANTNRVQCWYCQGAHFKRDCPKIKGDQTNTVSFVKSFCGLKPKADVSDYVYPVAVKGIEGGDEVVLQCWRDTGAQISCLREGSVPESHLTATGRFVPVIGVANSEIAEVPEYKIMVELDIVNGEMLVGLTPRSFGMPNATVPFLLGNDFGLKLMLSSMVGAVTTRRQARLLQAQTLSDSQADDSHETMSDASCDKQEGDNVDVSTEVDDVHLNSVVECVRNLFVNATVAQGEGIDRPRSDETVSCVKLAEMQRQDSSLNDVFSKVNELGEYKGYYVHANGLLVHSSHVDSQGEGSEDVVKGTMRIVVPKVMRGKVLRLAHCVPASGHLGVSKTRKRLLPFFYWPCLIKDLKRFVATCDVCQRNGKGK
jgi:hypothetical protein